MKALVRCVLALLVVAPALALAGAPPDGTYDVAVLSGPSAPLTAPLFGDLSPGGQLAQELASDPSATFNLKAVTPGALKSSLAAYDVLIIPTSARAWWTGDATLRSAVVAWVQSGHLLVLAPGRDMDVKVEDPIAMGFGSADSLRWSTPKGSGKQLSFPGSSVLVTRPNDLTQDKQCSSTSPLCSLTLVLDRQSGGGWTTAAQFAGEAVLASAAASKGALVATAASFKDSSVGEARLAENIIRFFDTLTPADTTPPTVVVDPPASPTSSTSVTLTGSITDASGIAVADVLLNGVRVGSPTLGAGGAFSFTLTLAQEGDNALTVRATDPAGNTGSGAVTVRLDTVAPVLSLVAGATLTKESTVAVTGSATDADGVTSVSLLVNGAAASTFAYDAATGAVSATASLVEGTNTLLLRATDAVGHVSERSLEVVRDSTGPTVHFHDTLPALTNVAALVATGTASDVSGIAEVHVRLNGAEVTGVSFQDGTVSASLVLVEGENELVLSATDAAGNTTADSRVVVLDTLAPSLTLVSPAAGSASGTSLLTLSVELEDASAMSVSVDGQAEVSLPKGKQLFSPEVQLAAEGMNSVTVTARDAAGNVGTLSISYLLDLTAPVLDIDLADGAAFAHQSGDVVTFTLHVDDLTATTVALPDGSTQTLPRGGGVVHGLVSLQEGRNDFAVRVTDEVTHAATLARYVLYDLTGPTGSFTSPAAGAFARGTVELSLESSDNLTGVASIAVEVDGVPVEGTRAGAGSWTGSVDTAGLADGAHAATATLTDGVGNVRVIGTGFTVDNTAPTLTLEQPAEGSYVRGQITVVASADDATSGVASVTVTVAGQSQTCTTARCSVAFDTTTLPDGTFHLSAEALDNAGNPAVPAQRDAVSDNSAPEKFLVSPTAGSVLAGSVLVSVSVSDMSFRDVECFVGGVSLGRSTNPTFSQQVSLLDRLDGALTVKCVATDLAGNVGTESATVWVKNWAEQLNPRTLSLKSNGGDKSVTLSVEGINVGLLLPTSTRGLALAVPGGAPVPATAFSGSELVGDGNGNGVPDVTLKFDREALISSIRAGLASGAIRAGAPLPVQLLMGGQAIGSDTLTVKQ